MAIRDDPPGRGGPSGHAAPDATSAGAPASPDGPAPQGAAGAPGGPGPPGTPPDPAAMLRSRAYLGLLLVAAVLGVPISAAAYGFLALVSYLQEELFTHLPHGLGFATAPAWWPLPMLVIGGVLTALAIRYLPGDGGPSPAGGFGAHPPPTPVQLPGVICAALATLAFGVVLGPEMPLIALGSGLGVLATKAARRRQIPAQGVRGLGTFSLAIPNLPHFARPDLAEFGWAIVIGIAAAVIGPAIAWLGRYLHPYAEKRTLIVLPLAGAAVAVLTIIYTEVTGKPSSDVLFSGQDDMGPLIQHAASYSVGALLLLLVCKGLAYGVSLSSFRGGPIFPALFIGTAGGIAMSHLPGLPLVAGVAMGLGAMSVAMLPLPLTSVLLPSLLL